jgi:hypothetical protein
MAWEDFIKSTFFLFSLHQVVLCHNQKTTGVMLPGMILLNTVTVQCQTATAALVMQ